MSAPNELVNNPHESLDVELKSWLDIAHEAEHRGALAKAILAIANHGGGHVLIGFDDSGDAATGRPSDLSAYGQDQINDLLRRFCDPTFHVRVEFPTRAADGLSYPVVVVPGGHKVPIRSRSETAGRTIVNNTYYIRRPGPCSAPPADGRDWDQLVERCIRNRRDEFADIVRDVMAGHVFDRQPPPSEAELHSQWVDASIKAWHKALDRQGIKEGEYQWMPQGHWTFSYSIGGEFTRVDVNELRATLQTVYRQITGWPVFALLNRQDARPVHREPGIVESHVATHVAHGDAAHSDYWRASVEGRLFLCRLSEGRDPWFLRTIPPGPGANGSSVIEALRRCPYAGVRVPRSPRRVCARSSEVAACWA